MGGDPTLLLPNAAGLTWLDDHHLLFSEIKTPPHMGIVTATENRSAHREIYFPAHQRGMAHYSYASPDRKWALVVEMDRRIGCRAVWFPWRADPLAGRWGLQAHAPRRAGLRTEVGCISEPPWRGEGICGASVFPTGSRNKSLPVPRSRTARRWRPMGARSSLRFSCGKAPYGCMIPMETTPFPRKDTRSPGAKPTPLCHSPGMARVSTISYGTTRPAPPLNFGDSMSIPARANQSCLGFRFAHSTFRATRKRWSSPRSLLGRLASFGWCP